GVQDRVAALLVLASAGADLGALYSRVKAAESDPQKAHGWDFLFLTACVQAPFADAIPLLEEYLKSADDKAIGLIVSALMKLCELPVPAATMMLIRALDHPNPRVRQCASVGLSQRRSRTALASLVDHYAKESDETLAVSLAAAIMASGPRSIADLEGSSDSPANQLWRCILAMRLRDATTADRLVTIASDPAQNWQLRRGPPILGGGPPPPAPPEQKTTRPSAGGRCPRRSRQNTS